MADERFTPFIARGRQSSPLHGHWDRRWEECYDATRYPVAKASQIQDIELGLRRLVAGSTIVNLASGRPSPQLFTFLNRFGPSRMICVDLHAFRERPPEVTSFFPVEFVSGEMLEYVVNMDKNPSVHFMMNGFDNVICRDVEYVQILTEQILAKLRPGNLFFCNNSMPQIFLLPGKAFHGQVNQIYMRDTYSHPYLNQIIFQRK